MATSENIAEISVCGQTWLLHPDKVVFWKDENLLILCDLHLGKSGHFRKAGIAAPGKINLKNFERLDHLINHYNPSGLLILGDLFHSGANREWFQFEEWRKSHADITITLITGNHDILHDTFYEATDILTLPVLKTGPFQFVHDPGDTDELQENLTSVSGHLHPGLKIKSRGRQKMVLPCFLFSDTQILLPAFGEFTGLHLIEPSSGQNVYAILDNRIVNTSRFFE